MREILWIVYLWLSFFIVKVCLVFFWVWFYCVSLSSVSRQNIQLDIFQKVPCLSTSFIFYSLILVFFGGVFSWLCFDVNVFRFASFFADFFMDFLDFVGGAQMRCARCFVCMEASLLRTYCVSWGTMYTLCTHCGITLHPEMLIAFSRSRQAHKCSQDKMSSTCGMCCTMNKSTHQEIVKCLSSSTVPSSGDFRHGYVALPHCPMLWFSASHVRPTKPPLLLKQRSREGADHENSRLESGWLVGVARWPSWPLDGICGGIVKNKNGIVQEQERHRQEQERVKNIIVNASFKAREPRVKIERKIIQASKHHLFFCCVCPCVSWQKGFVLEIGVISCHTDILNLMHYAHYALWQDEMHQLLDLDDPRPILIWGTMKLARAPSFGSVAGEAVEQWSAPHQAHSEQRLGQGRIEEQVGIAPWRGDDAWLERCQTRNGTANPSSSLKFLVVSLIQMWWAASPPLQSHGALMTRSPKCWWWSVSAVSAMAFDADGRERRFFVPPLTSEELSQKEAIMKSFSSCGNCSVTFNHFSAFCWCYFWHGLGMFADGRLLVRLRNSYVIMAVKRPPRTRATWFNSQVATSV